MDIETIRDMHEYNIWAMERILDRVAQISNDQFVAENDTPWGSIRNELVHVVDVHRRWLNWADGSMSGEEAYNLNVEMDDYPDVSTIRALWTETMSQTTRFLERMTASDLTRHLSHGGSNYTFSIPVWKVMIQIAFHSMQHRAEIAMVLTRLGHSPGDIDYIFYAFQTHASTTS